VSFNDQTPPPDETVAPADAAAAAPATSVSERAAAQRGTAAPDAPVASPAITAAVPPPVQGAPDTDPARAKVTAAPGKGFTVETADGRFGLNLRARIQLRNTFAYDENQATNELNVKTLRLIFTGNVLAKDLTYRIQLALGARDFEPGNASPIFDAQVDWKRWKNLNVRVGQYFVPFDRARTTRELALQLVDRHQVVRELTLDRDVGLMLYSDDPFGTKERLGYALFVGGGEGRNRFGGQPMGPLVVARLIVKPWGNFDDDVEGDLDRRKTPKLALGVAGAYNSRSTRVSSTYGADFQLGQVDHVHGAVDLVWKWRGWSVTAEGLVRKTLQDELRGTIDGVPTVELTRSGYGYFVQSGVMVHRLVELVGRWDDLYAWAGTDPAFVELVRSRGRQVVGGLNVYLNGHAFKLQADYSYAFGSAFDRQTDPGAHLVRVQLDATF